MTRYEAMNLYLLACLIAKYTGEYVETFLQDASRYADKQCVQDAPISPAESPKSAFSEAVERIYKAYPAKCPNRGTSTGKCSKDKKRIEALLKSGQWDEESLLEAIQRYAEDCYTGNSYIKNFSTFLNNIPEYEDDDYQLDQEQEHWQ